MYMAARANSNVAKRRKKETGTIQDLSVSRPGVKITTTTTTKT